MEHGEGWRARTVWWYWRLKRIKEPGRKRQMARAGGHKGEADRTEDHLSGAGGHHGTAVDHQGGVDRAEDHQGGAG